MFASFDPALLVLTRYRTPNLDSLCPGLLSATLDVVSENPLWRRALRTSFLSSSGFGVPRRRGMFGVSSGCE